jgi:hypothetical protein
MEPSSTGVLLGFPLLVIQPSSVLPSGDGAIPKFLEDYLCEVERRQFFARMDLNDASSELTRMFGEEEPVPVFFARTYADMMVATREPMADTKLPNTVPELMRRYFDLLNREAKDCPDDRVWKAAMGVAHACFWSNVNMSTRVQEALAAIVKTNRDSDSASKFDSDMASHYWNHFRKMGLIRNEGSDRFRFVLDPVAEYLSGLHSITTCQSGQAGKALLAELNNSGSRNSYILVLLVLFCWLDRHPKWASSDEELAVLTGLAERTKWKPKSVLFGDN